MAKLRLCIVTELLQEPFDEGMKIFANSLIIAISRIAEIQVLAINCLGVQEYRVTTISANKLFISMKLRSLIRKINPSYLIYIPAASSTLNSFIRARILKFYCYCPIGLIALQPRYYSFIVKKMISMLKPDIVFTQSKISAKFYSQLGIESKFLNPAVDLEKFIPADENTKDNIRKKYMISKDTFLVLHCGHIKQSRNLNILKTLTTIPKVQVLIVSSTSTKTDKKVLKELQVAGSIVYQDYIDNIADIYQMSDCYVFPVICHTGAIEMPLSILEAMACNLPILCTQFGSIYQEFGQNKGLYYFANENELRDKLVEIKTNKTFATREIVRNLTWHKIAQDITNNLEEINECR